MQPLQNNVEYSKEKVQPLGQAQTQTKEQPVPERSFTDRAIDGGLNLGIDALDGAQNVLGNAFIGGMADAGIKGTQFVASKMPFLSKIPGAARVAPYLMRDPRLAAAAATGTAAYQGTKYLMDKTGAAEGIANMIVGNKDYSQVGNQTEEQKNLMDQGYDYNKPIYAKSQYGDQFNNNPREITGYERTPGFQAHIQSGGTQESYANRNDDMPQGQGGPAPQGGYSNPNAFNLDYVVDTTGEANPMLRAGAQNPGPNAMQQPVDLNAYQPNLQTVQAPQQASQPNLQAVQQAPQAQAPGIPQQGDLVGSYQDSEGRNVGIFEGQSLRNKDGELTYINNEQLSDLENRMDAQGAPVISGEREGNLVPFMDNMGNVQYGDRQTANGMNAIEAQYQQEDKAAHQRFLQSDAAKQMTARSLDNARADVATRNAQSQAREDRMDARPDFMKARPGVSNSIESGDGLTDAERRKIFPNPADAARSKAGLRPDGSSMADANAQAELKRQETQARINALKERDPSKYEANIEVVNGIMDGPQFKGLDDAQKAKVKTLLMLELSGLGTDETEFEFDGIVYPEPADGNGDGSNSSASE